MKHNYTQHNSLLIFLLFMLLCSCTDHHVQEEIFSEEELGEVLFFDPILSRDSSLSCASCHKPEFAFADNVAFSSGVFGKKGKRNTPSVMNQSDRNHYFWDGRAETLEEQALGPIENPEEMDFPVSLVIKRLIRSGRYKKAFMNVYGMPPDRDLLARALASFERTLETGNNAFDRYMRNADSALFSESAKRGLDIFNNKGKCFDCHFGVDFSGNDQFRNIGLYDGEELNDKGRFLISGKLKDLGSFKTPGLRNIFQTAPYMHNGMFKTLREVIDYYDQPDQFVKNSINRDTLLSSPLGLSEQEKMDLESFLMSLSDERFAKKISASR
jgi:cytochrome c peroxidase